MLNSTGSINELVARNAIQSGGRGTRAKAAPLPPTQSRRAQAISRLTDVIASGGSDAACRADARGGLVAGRRGLALPVHPDGSGNDDLLMTTAVAFARVARASTPA